MTWSMRGSMTLAREEAILKGSDYPLKPIFQISGEGRAQVARLSARGR